MFAIQPREAAIPCKSAEIRASFAILEYSQPFVHLIAKGRIAAGLISV